MSPIPEDEAAVWRDNRARVMWARLPYHHLNRTLMKALRPRRRLEWGTAPDGQSAWLMAASDFHGLVTGLAECGRFSKVWAFDHVSLRRRCGVSCQNAVGESCDCPCGGRDHGHYGLTVNWIELPNNEGLVTHDWRWLSWCVDGRTA